MVVGMLTYLMVDHFETEISSHICGLLASAIAMIAGTLILPNKTLQTNELS
jgi:hypothetical protein